MRAILITLAAVVLGAVLGAVPARADELGVSLPAGARRDGDRFAATRGFAAAVAAIRTDLARRGLAHHVVGPYRARGVDVARFLSKDATTAWLAIHVYRVDGKTWIFLVKRPASSSPRPLDGRARVE